MIDELPPNWRVFKNTMRNKLFFLLESVIAPFKITKTESFRKGY